MFIKICDNISVCYDTLFISSNDSMNSGYLEIDRQQSNWSTIFPRLEPWPHIEPFLIYNRGQTLHFNKDNPVSFRALGYGHGIHKKP